MRNNPRILRKLMHQKSLGSDEKAAEWAQIFEYDTMAFRGSVYALEYGADKFILAKSSVLCTLRKVRELGYYLTVVDAYKANKVKGLEDSSAGVSIVADLNIDLSDEVICDESQLGFFWTTDRTYCLRLKSNVDFGLLRDGIRSIRRIYQHRFVKESVWLDLAAQDAEGRKKFSTLAADNPDHPLLFIKTKSSSTLLPDEEREDDQKRQVALEAEFAEKTALEERRRARQRSQQRQNHGGRPSLSVNSSDIAGPDASAQPNVKCPETRRPTAGKSKTKIITDDADLFGDHAEEGGTRENEKVTSPRLERAKRKRRRPGFFQTEYESSQEKNSSATSQDKLIAKEPPKGTAKKKKKGKIYPFFTCIFNPDAREHAKLINHPYLFEARGNSIRCHNCKGRNRKLLGCPLKNDSHSYCAQCLSSLFAISMEDDVSAGTLLWACPICGDACPCAPCEKRRKKAALRAGKVAPLRRLMITDMDRLSREYMYKEPEAETTEKCTGHSTCSSPSEKAESTTDDQSATPTPSTETRDEGASQRSGLGGETRITQEIVEASVYESGSCCLCTRRARSWRAMRRHPLVPQDGQQNPLLCCDQCLSELFERRRKIASRGALILDGERAEEVCAVCGDGGPDRCVELALCSSEDCPRAFCQNCLPNILTQTQLKRLKKDDDWYCVNCAASAKSILKTENEASTIYSGGNEEEDEVELSSKGGQSPSASSPALVVPSTAREIKDACYYFALYVQMLKNRGSNQGVDSDCGPTTFDDGKGKTRVGGGAKGAHASSVVSRVEDETEDSCLCCKDGGELIECDYGRGSGARMSRTPCLKVFHQECLGFEVPEEGEWCCPRHACVTCGAESKMRCYFCPVAYCKTHFPASVLRGDWRGESSNSTPIRGLSEGKAPRRRSGVGTPRGRKRGRPARGRGGSRAPSVQRRNVGYNDTAERHSLEGGSSPFASDLAGSRSQAEDVKLRVSRYWRGCRDLKTMGEFACHRCSTLWLEAESRGILEPGVLSNKDGSDQEDDAKEEAVDDEKEEEEQDPQEEEDDVGDEGDADLRGMSLDKEDAEDSGADELMSDRERRNKRRRMAVSEKQEDVRKDSETAQDGKTVEGDDEQPPVRKKRRYRRRQPRMNPIRRRRR